MSICMLRVSGLSVFSMPSCRPFRTKHELNNEKNVLEEKTRLTNCNVIFAVSISEMRLAYLATANMTN